MYSFNFRGYSSIANIQNLLEYDTTQLEDLLEEGDLIQECHAENTLLMDFFCRPTNLRKILLYTIGCSPQTEQQISLTKDNKMAKYAFICCELVCSEIPQLLKAYLVGKGRGSLKRYLSFLDSSTELGRLESLYFYRTVNSLLQFSPFLLLQFVREEQPEFPQLLLRHLSSSSIVELTGKLIWNESLDATEAGSMANGIFIDFFNEQHFFQHLFDLLLSQGGQVDSSLVAAQQLLVSLGAHSKRSALFVELWLFDDNLRNFFTALTQLDVGGKERLTLLIDFFRQSLSFHLKEESKFILQVESIIGEYLNLFIGQIKTLSNTSSINKLGLVRLKMAELMQLLISLVPLSPLIGRSLVEAGCFSLLIELFFEFKRNNFLHTLLVDSVKSCSQVGKEGCDICMKHLLLDTHLLQLILEAFRMQASVRALPLSGSPQQTVSYMGHLVVICDLICAYSTEHPSIDQAIRERLEETDWTTFITTNYATTKSIESSLLGGMEAPTILPEDLYSDIDNDVTKESFISVQSSNTLEQVLFFTQRELTDFQYDSLQAEQLGRLIITRIAQKINSNDSDEGDEEDDDSDEENDSFPICSSLGLVFNEGPPTDPTYESDDDSS